MKKCGKCKKLKPIKNFSKRLRSKDGLCCYCKLCQKKYRKKWFTNKNILTRISEKVDNLYKPSSHFQSQSIIQNNNNNDGNVISYKVNINEIKLPLLRQKYPDLNYHDACKIIITVCGNIFQSEKLHCQKFNTKNIKWLNETEAEVII